MSHLSRLSLCPITWGGRSLPSKAREVVRGTVHELEAPKSLLSLEAMVASPYSVVPATVQTLLLTINHTLLC